MSNSQINLPKTALADAEVEYQDHKSDTIYTSFPIKKSNLKDLT